MEEEKLRAALEKLYFELLQLGHLDEATQKKVDALSAYLREVLNNPELKDYHGSLENLLEDSTTEFEVSHPKMTELANGVMRMLSSIGI